MKLGSQFQQRMSKHWFYAVMLVSITALSGCASKPEPIATYALTQEASSAVMKTHHTGSLPLVQIEPVMMAGYLNGNGIVVKTSPTQYVQAKNNIWIDNINQQIEEKLVSNLQGMVSNYDVMSSRLSLGVSQKTQYKVSIYISDFYGHYDGYALLSGQWQIKNEQGKVIKMKPFTIKTQLNEDGYDALVYAMSQNVDELASQIQSEI